MEALQLRYFAPVSGALCLKGNIMKSTENIWYEYHTGS
jgi:hypothetical protein